MLVIALAVGLAVGLVTSPAQGLLSDSVSSLANSAGPWSLVAFLVARRSATPAIGALAATVTLACCELGYAIATELRGDANAVRTVVFWLTAAALAGPALGVAAVWSRRTGTFWGGTGFGVVAGVLVGEGVYGLTEVRETTDWRYWTAEIVLGAAIVVATVLRQRTPPAIAGCLAGATAAAITVYAAAVTI